VLSLIAGGEEFVVDKEAEDVDEVLVLEICWDGMLWL
jgi:hypothetical protein